MGEKTYQVGTKQVCFSESDTEFACLCTFPHNDNSFLEIDRAKALVLFGAVVRLIHDGYYTTHGEYIYIPGDVPAWIIEGVRKLSLPIVES